MGMVPEITRDEILVTMEMINAGLRELAIVGDAFASASALTGSDLRSVYIAMRQLEPANRPQVPHERRFRRKIGFEDRFQHQQRCCHADPIPHARDAQRPEFAVGLRYKHSSDWLWPVGLLSERKRQFSQPSLDPIRLDVRKILVVDARRALVRAALGIGMRQNVVAADLVVQSVEAIAGLRLSFRV